jgi:dephospho-CoA kinase
MRKIGVTGGIGSGKTTVCNVFEILGVPVFNSDIVAKELMNSSPDVKKALIYTFGSDIYSEKGLNREILAAIVFNKKDALNKINSIVHPAVRNAFQEWCFVHKDKSYVIQEAAILFESGAYKQLDEVVMVYAPEQERIERVVKRNNLTTDDVKKRIDNQLSDEEQRERANYVINNFANHLVIPQVLEIHHQLID